MEYLIALFWPLLLIALIVFVVKQVKKPGRYPRYSRPPRLDYHIRPHDVLPYVLKPSLLTGREVDFFLVLRPIAKKYGLGIAIKPRLADFIEVTLERYVKGSHFHHYFNKISAKHVDFLLCDVTTFRPVLAFELDDYTHKKPDRMDRDAFVDQVYASIGLKAIHFYDYCAESIDRHICEALDVNMEFIKVQMSAANPPQP